MRDLSVDPNGGGSEKWGADVDDGEENDDDDDDGVYIDRSECIPNCQAMLDMSFSCLLVFVGDEQGPGPHVDMTRARRHDGGIRSGMDGGKEVRWPRPG